MHQIEGFLFWIIVGVVAGFLASKIVNKGGEGLFGDLGLGILGAIVGGFITDALNIGGGGWLWSILVATVGAIILLVVYHAITGRRSAS